MRHLLFTLLICALTKLSFAALDNESSKKALYLENYREIAVQQMNKYGIPASITLAQGMLESGYGESALAKKSNNHFGIKCHSDWTGTTTYAHDDKPNECFRVYASVADSYEDHSLFLTNNKRYASLFLLDKKDYKGWAEGLKSAGYATSPTYATLLISLIEESSLQNLDEQSIALVSTHSNGLAIQLHENKVRYVKAEKGDTYYKIAQRVGVTLKQLKHYNESFKGKDVLKEGDKVYIDPRRLRSKVKKSITLTKSMSLREIAQEEAIKLKPLMRRNPGFTADEQLPRRKEIRLR
jgi:hypothetical protein